MLHHCTRPVLPTVCPTGLLTTDETISHSLDNSLKSQLVRFIKEAPSTLLIVREGAPVTVQFDIGKDGIKLPEEGVAPQSMLLFLPPLESPGAQPALISTVWSLTGHSVELPVIGQASLGTVPGHGEMT